MNTLHRTIRAARVGVRSTYYGVINIDYTE